MRSSILVLLAMAGTAPARLQDNQDELPLVRIEGRIETWYKMTQKIGEKEEHVGYAAEAIEEAKSGTDTTYNYSYDLAAGVFTQGQMLNVSLQVNAQLDAQFEIASLSGKYVEGDKEYTYEYYRLAQEKFIRINNERRFDVGKEEVIHFLLPLTTLQLRQQGALTKRANLSAISMFSPKGDQGRNTAEVKIEVVRHEKVDKLEKEKGKVSVSVLSVSGMPTTIRELAHNLVQVDRWGRAVLIESEGDLTIAIAKTRDDAVGSDTMLRDRRDPFRKDLVMVRKDKKIAPKDPKDKDPRKVDNTPKMTEAEKNKLLGDLGKQADAVIQAHVAKNFPEANEAYKVFLASYVQLRPLLKTPTAKDAQQLMGIKQRVEGAYVKMTVKVDGADKEIETKSYGGWQVYQDEAVPLKRDLVRLAANHELPEMEKKLQAIQDLLKRPEFDADRRATSELQDMLDECEQLTMTTRVQLELLKFPVKLTGTSVGREDEPQRVDFEFRVLGHRVRVTEDVPFLKSTSFARIRLDKKEADYRVGDTIAIPNGPELRVDVITRYGATIAWPRHQREVKSKKKVWIEEQLRELPLTK